MVPTVNMQFTNNEQLAAGKLHLRALLFEKVRRKRYDSHRAEHNGLQNRRVRHVMTIN